MAVPNQLIELLGKDVPSERCALLDHAHELWMMLSQAIPVFHECPAENATVLANSMCRWRFVTAKLKWRDEEDLAAVYLVEAAMRMALLDWLHAQGDPAQAAAEVVGSGHKLSASEGDMCSRSFAPIKPSECETFVRSVTGRWNEEGSYEREIEQLPKLAHALLIVNETTSVPSAASVVWAAKLGVLATQRALLRHLCACGESQRPDNADAVRLWVEKRIAAPKSEAATKGHSDAMALDCLDPLSLPQSDANTGFSATSSTTSVAHLLTLQPPDIATKAAEKARRWTTPATPREMAIISFSVFDYACKQLHGFHWSSAFTATDARPAAALERVRRYAQEKMAHPPPLAIVVDDSVVLLGKENMNVKTLGRYRSADGLAAWIREASDNPCTSARLSGVLSDAQGLSGTSNGDLNNLPSLIPI